MSWEAVTWAYQQEMNPSARKFVLVTLANWSNAIGVCWGPQERLAAQTGQAERTVRDHLNALEDAGIVGRVERRDKKGRRDWDGYVLDPHNELGLEKFILKRKPELLGEYRIRRRPQRRSGGGEKADGADGQALEDQGKTAHPNRQDPPVGQAAGSAGSSSGEIRRTYRQDPPNLPAGSAGISKENPSTSNQQTEGARARDPSAPGAGVALAEEQPEGEHDPRVGPEDKPAPVNALWREREAALIAAIGERAWRAWLSQAIPEADDGETYTLAVPTAFFAEHIKDQLGEAVEAVLGRRLIVVARSWVTPALRERERRAELAAKGAEIREDA